MNLPLRSLTRGAALCGLCALLTSLAQAQNTPTPDATASATAPAIATPAAPFSPAKRELSTKILSQQQSAIEAIARQLTEQPFAEMLRSAGGAIMETVPKAKQEATAKAVQATVRKYADEAVPLVRERALKIAPTTIGAMLEEKFSEDELRQIVAWLESPVNRKFGELTPALNDALLKKLVEEGRPLVDPKIAAAGNEVSEQIQAAGGGRKPGAKPRSGAK